MSGPSRPRRRLAALARGFMEVVAPRRELSWKIRDGVHTGAGAHLCAEIAPTGDGFRLLMRDPHGVAPPMEPLSIPHLDAARTVAEDRARDLARRAASEAPQAGAPAD